MSTDSSPPDPTASDRTDPPKRDGGDGSSDSSRDLSELGLTRTESGRTKTESGRHVSVRTKRLKHKRWKALKARLRIYFYLVMLSIGGTAIVMLVLEAGPARVERTIFSAGYFIPLIALLEASWVAMDVFVLRTFFHEHAKKVPIKDYVRSAALACTVMLTLPAGRAGAEATRASMLSKYVGGPRATAGAAQVQGMALLANTAISIPCIIVIAVVVGWDNARDLIVVVGINGLLTAFVGFGIVFAPRNIGLGGWLGRRFKKLATHGQDFDEVLRESPPIPLKAIAFSVLGRLIQTFEYGLILYAFTQVASVSSAFIAEGIHLVGAGMGDLVPNQVGITEAAYRLFAGALGLGNSPEKAVSIALIARFCQYIVVASCFLYVLISKPTAATTGERTRRFSAIRELRSGLHKDENGNDIEENEEGGSGDPASEADVKKTATAPATTDPEPVPQPTPDAPENRDAG